MSRTPQINSTLHKNLLAFVTKKHMRSETPKTINDCHFRNIAGKVGTKSIVRFCKHDYTEEVKGGGQLQRVSQLVVTERVGRRVEA